MAGFAGVSAGLGAMADQFGNALHERNIQNYNAAIQTKANLMDAYKALRDDPRMQDMWEQIAQKQLGVAAADPRKFLKGKIPSEFDPSDLFMLHSARTTGTAPSPGPPPPAIVPRAPAGQSQEGPAAQGMTLPPFDASQSVPGMPGVSTNMIGPPPAAERPANEPPVPFRELVNPEAVKYLNPALLAGGAVNEEGQVTPSRSPIPGASGPTPSVAAPPISSSVTPRTSAFNGAMRAVANNANPPSAASEAPGADSSTVVPPAQASAAIAPPPIMAHNQSALPFPSTYGGPPHVLSAQELLRRGIENQQIVAQSKLQMLEPYLAHLDPQMANIMRMEVVNGGQGAGATALLNIAFAAPQKEQIDASTMTPDQKAYYGLPPDAAGKWTTLRTRTGQTVGAYQGWAGSQLTVNDKGVIGRETVNNVLQNGGQATAPGGGPSYTPGQVAPRTVDLPGGTTGFQTAAGARTGAAPVPTGGVVPSYLSPKFEPTATGGVQMTTPADVLAGKKPTPVQGAVSPSMLQTQHSGTSSLDAEGNTVTTSRSGKIAPGAIPPPPVSASATTGSTTNLAPRIAPFNPTNRIDNIVRMMGQDAQRAQPLLASRQDKVAVGKRMAELGIDPNNVTGSMRERAANANLVLQHLNEVQNIIDEADRKGELGIVASRWNQFLTGKLGDDPTPDKIFSKLATNLTFLQSAVAMAHGGLRGGGSPQMVEHWEQALAAKDPQTLKQQLNVARNWMQGYASLDPRPQQGGNSIAPPPANRKPLDQIFK